MVFDGTWDRSNLVSDRNTPPGDAPADSRQTLSKFCVGAFEASMTSWALSRVGCSLIVGSITTGYRRSGAPSQAASGVIVTSARPPATVTRCETRSLNALPVGEPGSSALSYMYGFGSVNSAGPSRSAAKNAIEPSGCCAGRTLLRSSANV
ncbi:hypothetical protein ACQP2F_16680 [Actinoplanes sp. CA-030573]|uniref:hypothetical protein n=1 Tax=Actinoplanes sp. CA-030573 TaxID=3239898 RepID=UPI003D91E8D4